ncbi:U-box domain-containing protein [Musa troglodytarum]|uniref:RING-type E3 ubiquitin transferase n=1 Tax=Musa troglodytarum TaxID=320322 RepID=A0A9E7JV23_9LILI|nr:U-box domain-containing protein [Musa troglodytarum]
MAETTKGATAFPLVAVAVDKDKSSQAALKWALDNVVTKNQILILIHVNTKASPGNQEDAAAAVHELLVPFRCFCQRKDVNSVDIVLDDTDVTRAVVDFVAQAAIEKLVVGASRSGFIRSFRSADISTSISKSVPDFCTTYIITKGKLSTTRNAIRAAPTVSPLRAKLQNQATRASNSTDHRQGLQSAKGDAAFGTLKLRKQTETIESPINRKTRLRTTRFSGDSDTSFASSSRTSTDRSLAQRFSYMSDGTDRSSESVQSPTKSFGAYSYGTGFSSLSHDSSSSEASVREYVEAEMNRLRLELKQTMDRYSSACKEAIVAKQKAMELQLWNMGEQQRLEEARVAGEAALAMVEKEKAKRKAAMEAAEVAKLIADSETRKRRDAELKLVGGYEEDEALDPCSVADLRYRRYTIDEIEAATDRFAKNRKIGEGGYGPVFRCYLDHTDVAVKVLRPDAAQGRSQFQQEVEILSCIRHPNMVLLLGACPEYCCLVYEYMANGSLEDRLFRRGNTPPIPWQYRFRIAAEIGTGLLFLHQTKPEPLVHRDLKPANILLDQNYVSKISDVGLARLVPPSVADSVTQYRMTSAAGTFCYIDPEYQQTGMLGTKSDVYSLGVLLLQLITGRPPMGLTHHVERSIEKGTFAEMLDPSVRNWPVEEALSLAKIALRCVELRRRDRPDLATIILPELNRLRAIGVDNMRPFELDGSILRSPVHSEVSLQDLRSGPLHLQSGYESPRGQDGELSIFGSR